MEQLTTYEKSRSSRSSFNQYNYCLEFAEEIGRKIHGICEQVETECPVDGSVIYAADIRVYRNREDEIKVSFGLFKHIIPFKL